MNKVFKLLAGSLLLSITAAILAAFLVDPNDYKEDVEGALAAAIGHELYIAGNLRVSLFPALALEIEDVSVPGAPGFGGVTLAELPLVHLYPRLGALLRGRVELQSVRIQGLRLHLIRDPQGKTNWDSHVEPKPGPLPGAAHSSAPQALVQRRGSHRPAQAPTTADPSGADQSAAGVDVVDARVTWDDRQTGHRLELGGLVISADPIALDGPWTLRVAGSAIDAQGAPTARLAARVTLLIPDDSQMLRLEHLSLRIEELAFGDGVDASLELRADLDVNLSSDRYLADRLDLDIQVSGEALSGGRIDASAVARVELDLGAETLEITDLWIRSGALAMHGAAVGQSLLSTPRFAGELVLDALDLRAWLEQGGLPAPRTADVKTFRRLALRTGWDLAEGRLRLENLDLEVDRSRITGSAERASAIPAGYRFDLVADGFDLDRYLPPAVRSQAKAAATVESPLLAAEPESSPAPPAAVSESVSADGSPSAVEAAPLPEAAGVPRTSEPTASPHLDGRLRVGELKLAQLRFGSADVRIKGRHRVFDLDTRSEHFYRGQLAGRLSLDLRGKEPKVALAQRAEGIQTGPLLADMAGNDRLTGRGDISAELVATGRTADALRRSLSGKATIHVAAGVVKGFNLERLIKEAQARLRGEQPPRGLPTQTDFNDLTASAEVLDGVLTSRDLKVSADDLSVTGEGTVDLARERFDFRFEPVLVKVPNGQGLRELEGIPVPVRLTGTFVYPQWNVDVAGVLRAVAERELSKPEGGIFKKLEERTGIQGLEKGLRGLFGR